MSKTDGTKYGHLVGNNDDGDRSDPETESDSGERSYIDAHDVELIHVTDPDPEYHGYGRKKYKARLSYDDETGDPFVLFVIKYRWKGNFWRDTHDLDWRDAPEPVRQEVAAVLPVNSPEELDSGARVIDEGGQSRWENIHKPRMERMREEGTPVCTNCGVDLTDPKNGGDPAEDGGWVCNDPVCREVATPVCGPQSSTEEPGSQGGERV